MIFKSMNLDEITWWKTVKEKVFEELAIAILISNLQFDIGIKYSE